MTASAQTAGNDRQAVVGQHHTQHQAPSITTKQLINLKFDQLANKVFEELTHAHHSLHLFQAIDDILAEKHNTTGSPSISPFHQRYNNNRSINISPGAVVSGTHEDPPFSSLESSSNYYPISKSKTTSNAMSSLNNASGSNHSSGTSQHHQSLDYQHDSANSPRLRHRRSNPIVRSSTFGSGVSFEKIRLKHVQPNQYCNNQQPRSFHHYDLKDPSNFNFKQMNYSTSKSGSHRLSDDDEIIIVPTSQARSNSHSDTSTSPDNDNQSNDGELRERFSISRTKSFWERLSTSRPNQSKPILSSY